MYAAKHGLAIGFHGCDKDLRDKIVNGSIELKSSHNPYDWLGNGRYFWENNHQRALQFAEELKTNSRAGSAIKAPAVLGAVFDLGFCLDLLDTEYLQLAADSFQNLEDSFKKLGLALPINKTAGGSKDLLLRNLDRTVIENIHNQRDLNKLPPFDSVRGVFVEGGELYPGAGFNDKNHIQICIRNPNCIKGFFIPRVPDKKYQVP